MIRFEYKVELRVFDHLNWSLEQLNEEGEKGWEYVDTVEGLSLFKRKVND